MYNIRILLIIVLIWLYYIPLLQSICPNLCNGHGYCNSNNLCDCISPWDASPDCNQSNFIYLSIEYFILFEFLL